jgi:hypothetical protein
MRVQGHRTAIITATCVSGLTIVIAAVVFASRRRPRADMFEITVPNHAAFGMEPQHTPYGQAGHGRGYPSTYFDIESPRSSRQAGPGDSPAALRPPILAPVRTHASPNDQGNSPSRNAQASWRPSDTEDVESERAELREVGADQGGSGMAAGRSMDVHE